MYTACEQSFHQLTNCSTLSMELPSSGKVQLCSSLICSNYFKPHPLCAGTWPVSIMSLICITLRIYLFLLIGCGKRFCAAANSISNKAIPSTIDLLMLVTWGEFVDTYTLPIDHECFLMKLSDCVSKRSFVTFSTTCLFLVTS